MNQVLGLKSFEFLYGGLYLTNVMHRLVLSPFERVSPTMVKVLTKHWGVWGRYSVFIYFLLGDISVHIWNTKSDDVS